MATVSTDVAASMDVKTRDKKVEKKKKDLCFKLAAVVRKVRPKRPRIANSVQSSCMVSVIPNLDPEAIHRLSKDCKVCHFGQ